jgi:hypothetical protein
MSTPDATQSVGEKTTGIPVAQAEPARCPCGYDRHHLTVRAEPKYGVGSWLRLMVGVSARPERIVYRCRRCDTVMAETTERAALDASY